MLRAGRDRRAARHCADVPRRLAVSGDERRGQAADRALSGDRDHLGAVHRPSRRHADRVSAALRPAAVRVAAIGRVPLATGSAINFTAPLLVTALSVPLLGESVGWRRWSAVLVGFVGALIVIRPGSGFRNPAVLIMLLSAAAYALYQIATRWVAAYDDAAVGIIFTALLGALATSLALPFAFVMPKSLTDLALFAGLGLLGGSGHYLVIRAFQCGPAAVIAPLGSVELIGSAALGYLIFGNLPDLWTWAGAALIIASGCYVALRERRRAAR